jgi:hypothetical protein
MRKNHLKFSELRALPIHRVGVALGAQFRKVGPGAWAMVDPEKPKTITSLVLLERSNRWKRYSGVTIGGVSEGSVIDLVCHLRDCSFEEAVGWLSSVYL